MTPTSRSSEPDIAQHSHRQEEADEGDSGAAREGQQDPAHDQQGAHDGQDTKNEARSPQNAEQRERDEHDQDLGVSVLLADRSSESRSDDLAADVLADIEARSG